MERKEEKKDENEQKKKKRGESLGRGEYFRNFLFPRIVFCWAIL